MAELTRAPTPSEATVTLVESEEDHKQVFSDPHIQYVGLVKEMQHPIAGNIKVVGPPVKFSDAYNAIRSSPPLLGQHTDQVLREVLEYSPEKLQELKASGVIQQA